MTIKITVEKLEVTIEEIPKAAKKESISSNVDKREPDQFPRFDEFMDNFSMIQTGGDIGIPFAALERQLMRANFGVEEMWKYIEEAMKRGKIYERQQGIYMLTDRSKHVYNDVNLTGKFYGRSGDYDKSKMTD
jgi:hypothetical protein